MGFCREGTRFLLHLAHGGVDFSTSATVGRHTLNLSRRELRKNLLAFGRVEAARRVDSIFRSSKGYAEEFLRTLGAGSVDSFDVSAYQGCTRLHDFNTPIPDEAHAKWSAVNRFVTPKVDSAPRSRKRACGFLVSPASSYLGPGHVAVTLWVNTLTETSRALLRILSC
jgi:hypothetical protein